MLDLFSGRRWYFILFLYCLFRGLGAMLYWGDGGATAIVYFGSVVGIAGWRVDTLDRRGR
jgi:hypothetical protein